MTDEDFKTTICNEVKKNSFAVNEKARKFKKRKYRKETNVNPRVEIQYLK